MTNMKDLGTLLLVASLSAVPMTAQAQKFRFLATGDLPYSQEQDVRFRQLLTRSESEDFAFLMHVGDFKAQSVPCTDEEFVKIRDLFRAYPKPVVYTPGDNEWTDCHGVGADPVERLGKLRELFFEDRMVLRLHQLKTAHQNQDAPFKDFIENYRFRKSGVLFVVAHIVGSGNNHRLDHPASMKEFSTRNEANLSFLRTSFAQALSSDAAAVALVIHANPDFEQGQGQGFADFLATMREFLTQFRKPVVCIHGDSHYFRIDKPLKDETGSCYLHFTRMEVFGSPNVAAVEVTVDPRDPQVFSYRPYYAD